ncbi:MAG: sugar phosphate isomerase/epimerase [Gammaproteobacteria bacterium]|nr:sugar phosphate isomerase/epimerase [Gammaproteobacteria bacterium]
MSDPKIQSEQQLASAKDLALHTLATSTAISRRKFLGFGAAGVTGAALMSSSAFALNGSDKMPEKSKAKVGLQLYTVRDLMAQDVAHTLKLVAGVGYQELEFAGYFNQTPKALRAMLDGEGLTAPSCHLPIEAFDQGTDAIIEAALTMGHQYVVIPYLNDQQRGTSIDTYHKLAAKFNQIGEALHKAGLQFAYHNHDFEFNKMNDQVPYDVLLAETDPRYVAMELDLFWIIKAKLDPLAYFAKHPGRFPLWHVKDMDSAGNFADVGKGTIDFKSIFAKASVAGLQHAYVEHDATEDKIRTISQGFKALSSLRA